MAAEIISTVERRRSWPNEVKLRIIEEALAPGALIAAVGGSRPQSLIPPEGGHRPQRLSCSNP